MVELGGNLTTGVPIASPVFDGAREDDIVEMLDQAARIVAALEDVK